VFSSLMLLRETERQPSRRRRIEHWLLLLARCLLLIFLAGMFARPLWTDDDASGAGAGAATVVLVDASASMRREGLWQSALTEARAAVAAAGVDDHVAVALFADRVLPVWTFEEDAAAIGARGAVLASQWDEWEPGWGAGNPGLALQTAAAWLESGRADGAARRIVLVSDFQDSGGWQSLRDMVWPDAVTVTPKAVAPEPERRGNLNLALAALLEAEDERDGADPAVLEPSQGLRVRVSNSRDGIETAFQLKWEGAEGPAVEGMLAAGASRVVTMPPPPPGVSALVLSGDTHPFDNTVFLAPIQPLAVRVRAAGDAEEVARSGSAWYYLDRVLRPTADLAPEFKVLPPGEVDRETAVLVVRGDTAPTEEALAGWRNWLREGGVCVWVVSGSGDAAALATLAEGSAWKIGAANAAGSGYRMLARVETGDPWMAAFADARLRDLTKIRFWRHFQVEETGGQARVLAELDDGSAFLNHVPVAKGHLLVLSSGWHPTDSQLGLSSKFVPLWFGWLKAAGFSHQQERALEVGASLPLPGQTGAIVELPDGTRRTVAAGEGMTAEMPGVHRIKLEGGDETAVAVQVPVSEGRTEVMPEERWKELGIPLTAEPVLAADDARSAEPGIADRTLTEQEQRMWWWLLFAILLLAAAETWLARRPAVAAS
jgi:hypothetical protein